MIIFINEERPYLSWLSRHRQGFVADALRKPTRKQPVLHRANCPELKKSHSKGTHWTTGRHLKACSLDLEELTAWVRDEFNVEPACCATCGPGKPAHAEARTQHAAHHDHLTRLAKEIVDCVLDAAVVCLDNRETDYSLTAGDVAELLGKSTPQITAAFVHLVDDGYLTIDPRDGSLQPGATVPVGCHVYPTTKALRTLPAFKKMGVRDVEEERQRLYAVES